MGVVVKLDGASKVGASASGEADDSPQVAPSGWSSLSGWQAAVAPVDPRRMQAWHHRLLMLLVAARGVVLVTGLVMFGVHFNGGAGKWPWLEVGLVIAWLAALTLPVYRRHAHHEPTSENFILAQLLGDVALLAAVFYWTGGVENPYLVFLALPVTLAAYALTPLRLMVLVAAVATTVVLLARIHIEVEAYSETAHEISELVSVALLTFFAYMVASLSRNHERAVAHAREATLSLRGRQAAQTVAAQAADAVGSPLATMSVLVHDLESGQMPADERRAALDVLQQQIALCKTNLSALLEAVGQPRGDTGQRSDIAEVLRAAACECELMNPRLAVIFDRPLIAPPAIVDERSLFDAFVLMIQHLAQGAEGDTAVRIDARWSTSEIRVKLCGTSPARSDPDSGDDAAIELAASLVGRFGGTVGTHSNDGGLCLRVRIPIAPLGIVERVDAPSDGKGPSNRKA